GGTSFARWSALLAEHAKTDTVRDLADAWRAVTSVPQALPPVQCWAQAMLRSSTRIRHDTPSTARWWIISTSWLVSRTQTAL
ncbi:hypothetical protein PXH80_33850, partial [Mycolicibacterium smegmatis]|uniref:hypothetical protein n=1 Tax=Mycolicibacterium smegmatis TaxID=1772 RepID=UPI0023D99C67